MKGTRTNRPSSRCRSVLRRRRCQGVELHPPRAEFNKSRWFAGLGRAVTHIVPSGRTSNKSRNENVSKLNARNNLLAASGLTSPFWSPAVANMEGRLTRAPSTCSSSRLIVVVTTSVAFCSVVFAACSAVCRARSKKSALPQTRVASKRVAPRATMIPIRLAGITGCAVTTDQGLDVITDFHQSRLVHRFGSLSGLTVASLPNHLVTIRRLQSRVFHSIRA